MNATVEYEHLRKWTMPSNYAVGLEGLGGESDTVRVIREGHWAVGWVEWIGIHESDTEHLALADKMLADLEQYPVLDDDHLSDLEYSEACEYWKRSPISERIRMCNRVDISIFAARRDEFPEDPEGRLLDYLRSN